MSSKPSISRRVSVSDQGDADGTPVKLRPGAKPKACRRCHQRKVRCSGGHPCTGCRQASKESECVYPRRQRVVRINQQYIDDLREENQRLRNQGSPVVHGPVGDNIDVQAVENHEDKQGPALADTPWFVDMHVLHTPILIAEASDSAFATRFRQAMSTEQHRHLPRVDYPSDELMLGLSDAPCPWPDAGKARLLVNVAVKCLGRCYHIVRGSVVSDELERAIQNSSAFASITRCKFWALFAIGEMYSTRTPVKDKIFPGIEYYSKATKVLRVVSERPTVEMVEVWLLLSLKSFYSLCLNRRHSAYSLAGFAVRTAIIMGLHLNVPESRLSDSLAREHRNRLWWTAYTFDRMWAAKLGYPSAVRDADIKVNLPSNPTLATPSVDFPDDAYFIARVGLARLSGKIIHYIYGQTAEQSSLSHRVQDCFKDLRQWLDELPTSLHIDPQREAETDPRARSLQLSFNQLAILATRPILLHVLRVRLDTGGTGSSPRHVPASATALSEACIKFARHSCRLLEDSWVNGSFMMFDYFYTQYLFSSGTILAISSLLDTSDHQADRERFQIASHFLWQLKENGNFAAAEFHQHIEAVGKLMSSIDQRIRTQEAPDAISGISVIHGDITQADAVQAVPTMGMMTAEMTLSDSVFQDLLEQPLSDLDFIDASMHLDGAQDFCWPDIYPENSLE